MDLDLAAKLQQPAHSKIVLCVLDGLGGLARSETERSELEESDTPNLDRLTETSDVGLTMPVGVGITPGSGPGHLALFGYDPYRFDIGRGVLEAVGIDFELGPDDVAARGNFCTLDADGNISDRRAGRIASEKSAAIVERLQAIEIEGVELFIEPVREHRFVFVLRGSGLGEDVTTTDPQSEGVPPVFAKGTDSASERTASYVNEFVVKAAEMLADEPVANGLTLRGFATYPALPQMREIWGLRAAALAVYPMYRGLAKLAGMSALACPGGMEEQLSVAREYWDKFDYFFIHYKKTDAAGEDGDFAAKVRALEEFDKHVPSLAGLGADVLMIAGDHSTPASMAAHSWHPVPFLLNSPFTRGGSVQHLTESECLGGSLGIFPAVEALPLAMAHAGRLKKYGA
ncbi:MAG: phosphoglycerate mutase [Dehalococcoidia bacterium]|nr:phosphoglycerate mutase [Dehalococcoidia bacterium]HCV00465.1 phosphoglycerate mutase [Dehalococcoidia bacterium]|tara:strand:+ start:135 stop:1337 length:1203 start_codon:yes stop_codon:yes gene_type:complete